MKRSSTPSTELRSLLVHVSGDRVGDALIKLPALRGFRRACPDVHVTWVTARRPSAFAGALAPLAGGLIDTIHEQTGVGTRLLTRLPPWLHGPFDAVLSSEARVRDTLVLRRVPHRRFVSPALGFALSHGGRPERWGAASVAERFGMLLALAAGVPVTLDPTLEVPARYAQAAARALPDGQRYVGLSPGAGGARKRWPLPHFVALAGRVAALGATPVFFLGPEEADLVETLRADTPEALFPEHDHTPDAPSGPVYTIALARRLACAVANDSGGGHLLAAGGRPLVTLYGHTSATKFRPPWGEHIAVSAAAFGASEVARIPVAPVADHVRDLLDRQP